MLELSNANELLCPTCGSTQLNRTTIEINRDPEAVVRMLMVCEACPVEGRWLRLVKHEGAYRLEWEPAA